MMLDTTSPGEVHRGVDSIQSLLAELVLFRAVGHRLRRYGRARDGGYVMVEEATPGPLYSFGIGDDVSFELAFAEAHDVPVYLHDPTVTGPPARHPRFVFQRRGLGAGRARWLRELVGVGQSLTHALDPWLSPNPARLSLRLLPIVPVDPLRRVVERRGDLARRDLWLKIDVEGAEYDALLDTPAEVLACFRQIALEVHGVGVATAAPLARQVAMMRHLNAGHALVHAHFNNFGDIVSVEGRPVPTVLELTWLRRDPGVVFEPATEPLPGPLDHANTRTRPDRPLDFWPFPGAMGRP